MRYQLINRRDKYELSGLCERSGDGERVRLAVDDDLSFALKLSKICACCATNVTVNWTVGLSISCSRTASIIMVAITSECIPKPPQPIAGNAEIHRRCDEKKNNPLRKIHTDTFEFFVNCIFYRMLNECRDRLTKSIVVLISKIGRGWCPW